MNRKLIFALFIVALAGCVAVPVSQPDYYPAPAYYGSVYPYGYYGPTVIYRGGAYGGIRGGGRIGGGRIGGGRRR